MLGCELSVFMPVPLSGEVAAQVGGAGGGWLGGDDACGEEADEG
ncbi:Uncharacterised protein [Dermatophilus congolensis]|uniref:Uncharacterized protein n=1 Tax=Dermatophilus congolensis TaxID=1863 RepID=A0AA46BPV3_9MICO|nr:Uncharacterised protein [Dermatophilus congolensis]